MIKFSLCCKNDHDFEAWFASNDEFDRLQAGKLVDCPTCGSTDVNKALMAPAVSKRRVGNVIDSKAGGHEVTAPKGAALSNSGDPSGSDRAMMNVPVSRELQQAFQKQLRELRKTVMENADNVGEKFPEEARKIHYGEAESRGIYGKASGEEAKELLDEGIGILPLPDLPEDRN